MLRPLDKTTMIIFDEEKRSEKSLLFVRFRQRPKKLKKVLNVKSFVFPELCCSCGAHILEDGPHLER